MTDFQYYVAKNRLTYSVLGVLVILAIGWSILSVARLRAVGHGTITIENVVAGSKVQIDGKTVEQVSSGTSTVSVDILAGEHTIDVTRAAHWPWTKTLTLEKSGALAVSPFLLPLRAAIVRVPDTGTERTQAEKEFSITLDFHPPHAVGSEDTTTIAWIDNNTIYARWEDATSTLPQFFCINGCDPILAVLPVAQPIANMYFLGGRNDVLLLTTPEGVFALELDSRGTQNFQPVYKKPGADFRPRDSHSLYIRDNEDLFVLEL